MPKRRVVSMPRSGGEMELDLVSYGRRGPQAPNRLDQEQIAQVARTVRRVPEVMVKVSGGARDVGGAKAHFAYLDRHGKLDIETDDGTTRSGRSAAADLVADWNLDLCRGHHQPRPAKGEKDRRPKLVHNIVLSMPGRTPPQAVLAAARKFARENFALQYRYAMVLHTDQAHPHVHLVVKCEHEYDPGKRLYIRKATLRTWREQFAKYLRQEGVAANATPRPLRGQARTGKKDRIHQRLRDIALYDKLSVMARKGRGVPKDSTFMRTRVAAVIKEMQSGHLAPETGKAVLQATRDEVGVDWASTAQLLRAQGETALATEVERFMREMPPVRTEKEQIAAGLLAELAAQRTSADHRARHDKPPSDRGRGR